MSVSNVFDLSSVPTLLQYVSDLMISRKGHIAGELRDPYHEVGWPFSKGIEQGSKC